MAGLSNEELDMYTGLAADLWESYVGDYSERTGQYKDWLLGLLRGHGCARVLDASAGTGVDSILLVEQGFDVTSSDVSKGMIAKCMAAREKRLADPAFRDWTIQRANWLTIHQDLDHIIQERGLFDAIIVIGSSIFDLPNEDQTESLTKQAFSNFDSILRPGGILIVDHRNHDKSDETRRLNIYKNSLAETIEATVKYKNGKLHKFERTYYVPKNGDSTELASFDLYSYPISSKRIRELIKETLDPSDYMIFGDFKPYNEDSEDPALFSHVAKKKK